MEYGFDKTFLTDEDLEQSMDDFIEAISQELEDEEWNTTVLDIQKSKQIQFAYSVLKYLTRGSDAVVSYKLHEPFKTMGSVSVEANLLSFTSQNGLHVLPSSPVIRKYILWQKTGYGLHSRSTV